MKEYWAPEDFIYEYVSDCLLAFPEQAACLIRADIDVLHLKDKLSNTEKALEVAIAALKYYNYDNNYKESHGYVPVMANNGIRAMQALEKIKELMCE